MVFHLVRLGLVKSPMPPPRGWIVAIDADGRVVANAMDPKGKAFHTVTSVNAFNDELFLGSNTGAAIGRMPIPAFLAPAQP